MDLLQIVGARRSAAPRCRASHRAAWRLGDPASVAGATDRTMLIGWAQDYASTAHGKMPGMSDLLDQAVQVLRSMPENMQEAAARTILNYAAILEDEQAHA